MISNLSLEIIICCYSRFYYVRYHRQLITQLISLPQSFYGFSDGYDMQDLVLLQTFLGLSLAVGIVASGSSINKTCQIANSRKIRISRQYVCQGCVILVSISIVIFSMLSTGYHTLCIVTWVYGLGLGGYRCKCPIKSFSQIDLFIHFLLTFFGRFIKDARAGASSGEVFYARLG